VPTVLLWLTMFLNLLIIVFALSGLPAVIRGAGLRMQVGVLLAAMFFLGGMGGSVVVGRLIDRFGAMPVLLVCYAAAAVAVASYGLAGASVAALYAVTLAAGAMGLSVLGPSRLGGGGEGRRGGPSHIFPAFDNFKRVCNEPLLHGSGA